MVEVHHPREPGSAERAVLGVATAAAVVIVCPPAYSVPACGRVIVAVGGGSVSWGGWALALGMAFTLAAAIAGWWVGSRSRLADAETDDTNVRVRR
jgi:hypothetical protein